MIKILISHIPNTLNYGSSMMAINLIAGLKSKFTDDIELYCDCDDSYHLNRLSDATGVSNLKSFYQGEPTDYSYSSMIKRYFFGIDEFIQNIASNFDVMIVLGGDDLSETYLKSALIQGTLYKHINKHCKVILASQSLGPFSGKYKFLARFIFKDILVVTRDDNSYNFSKNELKIKNIFKSRDLAFLPLPKQDSYSNILEREGIKNESIITVVPSGLAHEYTDDRNGYISTWYSIINYLHKQFPKYKVLLLSHVILKEKGSDSSIIQELLNKYSEDEQQFILSFTEPMQPAEARAILGNSYFVVTGRMHAAVSTFFMRKPALSIAYSEKYFGVIGRGLGLPELIIDARSKSWGGESKIVTEVIEKVKYIVNNYTELQEKIDKNVNLCTELAASQISFISSEINKVTYV